jgi:serine/threonine protein kinase
MSPVNAVVDTSYSESEQYPPYAPMLIPSGTVINQTTKIVRQVGQGGLGTVYEGWHIMLNRRVAVKVLNAAISEDSAAQERFRREGAALSKLSHKNLPTFYSYGLWNQLPFIVFEYIEGLDLETASASKQPAQGLDAIEIVIQICMALACAHEAGIIHRDLKPANILITPENIVKVIDFGLAKDLSSSAQALTVAGSTVGTVHYMSPEQARGRQLDLSSDIYSVGCILHQLLTGSPPFSGNDDQVIMQKHVSEEAPRLRDLKCDHANLDTLQTVIDKCMSKTPELRYETANELSADLQRIQHGGTAEASSSRAQANAHVPQILKRFQSMPTFCISVLVSAFALISISCFVFNQVQVSDIHKQVDLLEVELKTMEDASSPQSIQPQISLYDKYILIARLHAKLANMTPIYDSENRKKYTTQAAKEYAESINNAPNRQSIASALREELSLPNLSSDQIMSLKAQLRQLTTQSK